MLTPESANEQMYRLVQGLTENPQVSEREIARWISFHFAEIIAAVSISQGVHLPRLKQYIGEEVLPMVEESYQAIQAHKTKFGNLPLGKPN